MYRWFHFELAWIKDVNCAKIIDKTWKVEGAVDLGGIQHLLETCVSKFKEWNESLIKFLKIS